MNTASSILLPYYRVYMDATAIINFNVITHSCPSSVIAFILSRAESLMQSRSYNRN